MLKNFDDMQKVGKDNMDATMKSFGAVSKGVQAIAAEVADYSKKSFEDGTAAPRSCSAPSRSRRRSRSRPTTPRPAYEGFVAQATKIGELYADLAKETYKPFESLCSARSTA